MTLRQKVDNARVAFQVPFRIQCPCIHAELVFKIRNDISISRLLTELHTMHACLMARVDDLFEGQRTTHDMLRMLLVEVGTKVSRPFHTKFRCRLANAKPEVPVSVK